LSDSFKLDEVLKAAQELPPEDLPALIGQLAQAHATALARLTAPSRAAQAEHDELLNVTEAARRLGISEDYLYSHSREYPFTRRQGRKLLFSALGIDKYIRQQRT
jgi:excisionase family DNA binding protein